MVNKKFSSACQPCLDWHVRCDLGRPGCKRCNTRGIECPGYPNVKGGFRFKDQSVAVTKKQTRVPKQRYVGSSKSVRLGLDESPDTIAVNYFFRTYLFIDRDPKTNRGHFSHLVELYRRSSPGSALALATVAMAGQTRMISQRYGGRGSWHEESLARAAVALRRAISDADERRQDATLLAALLLDFSEQMKGKRSRVTPSLIHHHGCMALLRHRRAAESKTDLLKALIAATRSNAIRNFRNGNSDEIDFAGLDLHTEAFNPAVALDGIMARVLALQTDDDVKTDDFFTKATELQHELREWTSRMPKEWQPERHCSFETYCSLDVAYVYNQWRCINLALLVLIERRYPGCEHLLLQPSLQNDEPRSMIQAWVEQILFSIPYFVASTRATMGRSDLGLWYLDDILQWTISILDCAETRELQQRFILARREYVLDCT